MTAEEDEAEESALSEVLAEQDLLKLFRPRREVTALLDELRRNPLAILDSAPRSQLPAVDEPDTCRPSSEARTRPSERSPVEQDPDVLTVVVDYADGMTQEEIARKHDLHIQTVRKRLKVAGVVPHSHCPALTEQDLGEARGLLDSGLSSREVGRRLGVAHTTLLRAIRRADAAAADENHHHAPRDE